MSLDLDPITQRFPDLLTLGLSRVDGATVYQLRLPEFNPGRAFAWAELRLPKGFPDDALATITLSPDAVMRVPHVDQAGVLCTLEGDPGPGRGLSPEERVIFLLQAYQEQFLNPWLKGELDEDFQQEVLNYWGIEVGRSRSQTDPVREVWTIDDCPKKAEVRRGLLLLPNRIVIAADNQNPITNRLVQSMGSSASQRIGVFVADIPISHTFTPDTWPRTEEELDLLLRGRLRTDDYEIFRSITSRRGRGVHRVALMRNSEAAFAYLLPGGPPTAVENGKHKKTYPSLTRPLPLLASRFDPSWTVGRDQHPEVADRQAKHVLVLGSGALGSPIVDHLAKAGVGCISLVDDDYLSSANIGRHLLGAESVGEKKVEAVARRVRLGHPATEVKAFPMKAEKWLKKYSLSNVDAVLDLTGEQQVRWHVDQARFARPCPLLIGWMEPYVAAAHACLLPVATPWMQGGRDPFIGLEAVDWPNDVIRREPGCSSLFQSYTAAAAAHAVALIAEGALELIDGTVIPGGAKVISWVRGQRFLDRNYPGLKLREWAKEAEPFDGLTIIRPFP